jgi:hypothetical protein
MASSGTFSVIDPLPIQNTFATWRVNCQRLAALRVHFRLGFNQRPRATRLRQQPEQTNTALIDRQQLALIEKIAQRLPERRCFLDVFWAGELLEHRRGRHLEPADEGA